MQEGHDLSCLYTILRSAGRRSERMAEAVKILAPGGGSCDRTATNFGLRGLGES